MSALRAFLLLFALYAVTIGISAWFVLRIEHRQQLRRQLKSASSDLMAWHVTILAKSCNIVANLQSNLAKWSTGLSRYLRYHKKSAVLAAILLSMPAIFAVLFASRSALGGYSDQNKEMDPVVAALLQGEHLVLPPPLPPEVFVTEEIDSKGRSLGNASREWNLLDSDFRQRLLAVYRMMAMHGYRMTLIEGYRSPQRQTALAKLGPHITNAGPYQSYHQYGLAADSAFYRNGRIIISEKDPLAMEGYRLFGKYAESVGLVWGGRWKMMDFGHVEMQKAGATATNHAKLAIPSRLSYH